MAIKVFVGPYVEGPTPVLAAAAGGGGWKSRLKALCRWLAGVRPLSSAADERNQIATSSPQGVITNWAYRVTNYQRLRAAGVLCVISPPHPAAGISNYLDLEAVQPTDLREAEVFLVESGQSIPADGLVLEGFALVDEAAITGQSASVVRSAERESVVMLDSRVVDGQILVQVAPRRGHQLDWIDGSAQLVGRPRFSLPIERRT